MKINKKGLGLFLMLILSSNTYSATLVIEGGQLIGADGITFDGYTGSVRFVEGTCEDLFNGCDDASDLVFQSHTSSNFEAEQLANAANFSLLNQVFNAFPLYDLNVELTFGCKEGTTVALGWCSIRTPVFTNGNEFVAVVGVRNDENDVNDFVFDGGATPITNSTIPLNPDQVDRVVYAAWTVTPVPLPAAGPLFFSAMCMLGYFGKRRRSSQPLVS